MSAWDVYLPMPHGTKDKHIDTVFYTDDCTARYVHDSLINHDGYDPRIYVVCSEKRQSYGRPEK